MRRYLRVGLSGIAIAAAGVAALAQPHGRTASSAWSPIDNARVHVWSDQGEQQANPARPAVRITLDGGVEYLAGGDLRRPASHATAPGGYTVIVELKDARVPPAPNPSSYPLAFPRPNVKKVLDNDRVLVWDYTWTSGVPTPMHFHDKDVVVVYLEDGALRSTEPNGGSVINEHYFGFTKFNSGNRVHTEELVKGRARAIIVELK
jgi:hypothetical protein